MKTSVLIFFIVLSSLGLNAQYPKGHSPNDVATRQVVFLKPMLKLTDQQYEKVMQIYVDQFKSRDSLITAVNKRTQNLQARNAALTTMLNTKQLETDKKISAVLNEDQKLAYSSYISKRKPGFIMSITSAPKR